MSNTNAAEELQAVLDRFNVELLAAEIRRGWRAEEASMLYLGYTKEERAAFFASIDFDYDSGFGDQEVYGFVWLTDGSWLDRYEYDGSECWVRRIRPEFPKRN